MSWQSAAAIWPPLPERDRANKAEADKTEAYKVTLPAMGASSDLVDRVLAVLPGVEQALAAATSKRARP